MRSGGDSASSSAVANAVRRRSAESDERLVERAGEERGEARHRQAEQVAVEQRRVQARARQRLRRHDGDDGVGERNGETHERREDGREADVVHRPRDAADTRPDVGFGLQRAGADQRLAGAVVVAEIEVAVERQRVGDGEVVRLVAGAGMGAVRQKAPQRREDNDLQRPARPSGSRHRQRQCNSAGPRVRRADNTPRWRRLRAKAAPVDAKFAHACAKRVRIDP